VDRFEVWFGAIFLVLGLVGLLISWALLFLPRPGSFLRQNRWAFLGAPLIIGVIFSAIGGGFMGYGLWQERVEQRLLEHGATTRATVLGAEPTSTRVNGRYLWRVNYQYQDQAGQTHHGTSGLLSQEEALSWRPGALAVIRYDPDRPSTSIWLGR
jgi:hypothetical protein